MKEFVYCGEQIMSGGKMVVDGVLGLGFFSTCFFWVWILEVLVSDRFVSFGFDADCNKGSSFRAYLD